jgi:hypothetical protein
VSAVRSAKCWRAKGALCALRCALCAVYEKREGAHGLDGSECASWEEVWPSRRRVPPMVQLPRVPPMVQLPLRF